MSRGIFLSQVGTVDHCIRIWAETYSGCLDSKFVVEVDGRSTGKLGGKRYGLSTSGPGPLVA